jgi:arylformamidase
MEQKNGIKRSYFGAYPVLTVEAAEWLMKFKLKALGFDYISIDADHIYRYAQLHKIVLSKDICIIENLTRSR